MKKNIVILVDAMRTDYLNEQCMPFLYDLANNSYYIKKIIPSLGFCERAEILTGKEGNETGLFTAIELNKENSEFNKASLLFFLNFLYEIFDFFIKIFPSYFLFRAKKKIIRSLITSFFPNTRMPSYNIPPKMLNLFSLSEDFKDHSLPNAFNHQSLVDMCLEKGIKLNFEAFTALGKKSLLTSDRMRMDNVIYNIKHKDDDIYFLYVGVLDEQGHKHGPDSDNFKKILRKFDENIKTFISILKNLSDCNILLIGDHGMSDVKETVDFLSIVKKIVKNNKLRNDDVKVFCDSTLGRIWLKNDTLLKTIKQFLKENEELTKYGLVLEQQDYKRLNIPNKPENYGDLIWLANRGVMITPDYFHGPFPPKGMHGYQPNHNETFGTLILTGSKIHSTVISSAKLSDIKDIITKDMLEL